MPAATRTGPVPGGAPRALAAGSFRVTFRPIPRPPRSPPRSAARDPTLAAGAPVPYGRARAGPGAARRRHGPRLHPRSRRALLHPSPGGPRRPRDQGGAAARGRHAGRPAPARPEPGRPELLLRAGECGQALGRARPGTPRRPGRRAGPRPDRRRARRELPAWRDGPAGARPRRDVRRAAGPRVLLHLGVRPDRAVAGPVGVRPRRARDLGPDAPRTGRERASAGAVSPGGRHPGRHARLRRDLGRAPAAGPHGTRRLPRRVDAGGPDRSRGHQLRQRAQRRAVLSGAPQRHGGRAGRRRLAGVPDRRRPRPLAAAPRSDGPAGPPAGPPLRDPDRPARALARAPRDHRGLAEALCVGRRGPHRARRGSHSVHPGALAGRGGLGPAPPGARRVSLRPPSDSRSGQDHRLAVSRRRRADDAAGPGAVPARRGHPDGAGRAPGLRA